jgi:hypothetical protein
LVQKLIKISRSNFDSLVPITLGYILVLGAVIFYSRSFVNGTLQVAFGDSWIFTDLAKRIALNHSLRMEVFDIVYPPLYPLLISWAYFFKNPENIFWAIRSSNMVAYSATFIPLYLLLIGYSGLSRRLAFSFALLLSVAPTTIHYSTWLLSESLYIPLVAGLFLLISEEFYSKSYAHAFGFGFFLALLPLTKSIGLCFLVNASRSGVL